MSEKYQQVEANNCLLLSKTKTQLREMEQKLLREMKHKQLRKIKQKHLRGNNRVFVRESIDLD